MSSRKRKIINWNPKAGKQPAPSGQQKNYWLAIGLPLLALAILGLTAWLLWPFNTEEAHPAGQNTGQETPATASSAPAELGFVSKKRATQKRQSIQQALQEIRNQTDEHPTLLQNLTVLEDKMARAEEVFNTGNYPGAMSLFLETDKLVEDYRKLLNARETAITAYDEFVTVIEGAEFIRITQPAVYEKAAALGNQGGLKITEGAFEEAARLLHEGMDVLNAEKENREQILAQKELEGNQALTSGDKEAALRIFQEILRLQPGNALAQRGLKRAESIDRVHPLLQSASTHEKADRLSEARSAFEQAFALDPLCATAQQGKHRISRTMKDRQFEAQLAKAETAEKAGDWDAALALYQEASTLFPRKSTVAEAIARIKEQKRLASIEKALRAARTFEESFAWEKARKAYELVLKLDIGNEEAKKGHLEAGRILRAMLRFEKHMEIARKEAEKGAFQKAIEAFNEAMANKPSYHFPSPRQKELQRILKAQSEPVEVEITSNKKTYVSIVGLNLLGRFKGKTVTLLPGNYKFRGSRSGYKDVEVQVQVRNGAPMPPISIVCREKN